MGKGTEAIGRGLRALFGDIRWAAPPWARKLNESRRNRPRRFWSVTALIVLLPLLAFAGYRFWQSLPRPAITQVSVQPPGITRIGADDRLYPQPVTIGFRTEYPDPRQDGPRGAAKLELLGKTLEQGIRLEPAHPGEWQWTDENTLRFVPERDWPAGRTYTVHLEPRLFADGIRLADSTPRFTTPGINAELRKLDFYQHPEKASVHQVVATLRFTHAVDAASLKEHLTLGMRPSGADVSVEPEAYPYALKLGRHGREAYITTEPLTLPPQENFMKLTLSEGVRAADGPAVTQQALERQVRVPSVSTYFRVATMQAHIVRNEQNDPEQTLILELTDGVQSAVVADELRAWLLPDGRYYSHGEIDAEVLEKSRPLELNANPTEHEYAKLLSFRFDAPEDRQIAVHLPAGLVSQGGFEMTVPYASVLHVPEYPREANIMGEGALLPMTGSRTLSFQARGVPALRVEVFRLLEEQLVHLVTQTRGELKRADFTNYRFNEENIGKRHTRVLPLNAAHPGEATYASLDISPFLESAAAGHGLFVLRVSGWDPEHERRVYGADDRRFILVTDLGMIAKDNGDKTHELFVHSLSGERPVAGARVDLLGRNGLPVYSARTDARGHARLPDVSGFDDEREPSVYLVRHNGDLAFLPFRRADRQLDYSRFDTGGLRTSGDDTGDQLHALVFSDRGIYRPGEEGHLGVMVKRNDWQSVDGVPVEIALTGPRGNEVRKERRKLPADGFLELDFGFAATDPTGDYEAAVYLLGRNDYRLRRLGGSTLQVEEFQPDSMRIRTVIEGGEAPGWRTPLEYTGVVTLENLFGLPAQQRRVQASYSLMPTRFSFSAFPDFVFEDPYRRDEDRLRQSVSETLPEQTSDAEGEARFAIDLSQYGAGLYRLHFNAEGYETGGGRSVSAGSSVLVSPAERLVGWKADGDLRYLQKDAERNIRFVAVNPRLESVAAENLQLHLIERRAISTLVRQNDGTLQYQTVTRRVPLEEKPHSIPAGGGEWRIPTGKPGEYLAELRDAEGRVLARIPFSVIGERNITGELEKNAALQLKLDSSDYRPGERIEMQITAPYTGTGLITIERDRVYAYRWFTTDSTRTVQHITLPEGLEGNGYVNVTFMRALDSEEVFTQPLSYAVAPFDVDRGARTVRIELDAPEKVKPGDRLELQFATSRPARLVLFAVDEGILQVAGYRTPQPLDTFLRKRALEVDTSQIADLLLPEFRLLLEAAAAGGGQLEAGAALGANLNPFRRGVKEPVVWWSGIIETGNGRDSRSFTVPDHFDGELRLMAVASAPGAAGAATARTTVRGPFVLQPNVITSAAPGDEFTVSVGVTNALPADSGVHEVTLQLEPDTHLEVLGETQRKLDIAPGREQRATFRVRATENLGGAELKFRAVAGPHSIARTATLSVRPAVPYRTTIQAGMAADAEGELALERGLRPELAEQHAATDYSPLILADGLNRYLEHYPHGCTEQMVSRGFPVVGLLDDPGFAMDRAAVLERYRAVVDTLRTRQQPDGGFGFWPGARSSDDFVSIYAMHFLTDAAAQDVPVPEVMLRTGLDHLRRTAAAEIRDPYRTAYAIYVLTRNGMVTTNYLTRLQEHLEKSRAETWRRELAAAYMAASYRQLKLEELAAELIGGYRFAEPQSDYAWDLDSALARNAQYVYLLAKHFPRRLADLEDAQVNALLEPVTEGRFNTLSSAWTVLALGAWGDAAARNVQGELRILAARDEGEAAVLAQDLAPALRTEVPLDAGRLLFRGSADARLFYTATQTGYDRARPTAAVRQNLEIVREYVNDDGKVVTTAPQGAELTVRLRVRSLDGRWHDNVAIVDLLPGGFEVQRESVRRQFGNWSADYIDIREDRVVLYGGVGEQAETLTYRVKLTGAGTFTVPPAFAESMYHPDVQARALPGEFVVTEP